MLLQGAAGMAMCALTWPPVGPALPLQTPVILQEFLEVTADPELERKGNNIWCGHAAYSCSRGTLPCRACCCGCSKQTTVPCSLTWGCLLLLATAGSQRCAVMRPGTATTGARSCCRFAAHKDKVY